MKQAEAASTARPREKKARRARKLPRRRTVVLLVALGLVIALAVYLRGQLQRPLADLRGMSAPQLETYLRRHPTHSEAWLMLGELLLDEEQPERAAAALRSVLRLEPNSVDAGAQWALATGFTADVIPAEQLLSQLERQQPTAAAPKLALARLHQRAGNPNLAAKLFIKATELGPDNPEAWFHRSVLEGALGRYATAAEGFQKAQRLAPSVGRYYRAEADMRLFLNERAPALRLARRAQRLAPWDARSHFVLGKALLMQTDPKLKRQGEDAIERGLLMVPGWLEPRLELAKLRLARGQAPRAIRDLQELVTDFPSHRESRYQLGQAYIRSGRTAEGRKIMVEYQASIKQENRYKEDELQSFAHPNNPELHRKVARYCVTNGAILAAVMHYRDVLRLIPKDPEAITALKMLTPSGAGNAR